jgi:hypothetical protein
LLSALGALDSSGLKVIKFDVADVKPCLPYHVAFQIHVECMDIIVKCTIMDEGASTYVMSLSCWKSLGSPQLSQSMTMLTTFDGVHSDPMVSSPLFQVQLGGKTVEIEVEVVDAPLDYNILLGHNWIYAMSVVVSSIFHILCFPHEGKIVTIDQLSFSCSSSSASVGPLVPIVKNSQKETEKIGVRMYPYLMGTFNFLAPISYINAISSESSSSLRLSHSTLHISMTHGLYLL